VSHLPPHSGDGWPRRFQHARSVPLGQGLVSLTLHSGATTRDVAGVAAMMHPAVYLDHRTVQPDGTAVSLIFREIPSDVPESVPLPALPSQGPDVMADASTVGPTAWQPDVDAATVPAHGGLTPYELAVWELVSSSPGGAYGARIVRIIRREDPETVIAFAELLRDRRCGCHRT